MSTVYEIVKHICSDGMCMDGEHMCRDVCTCVWIVSMSVGSNRAAFNEADSRADAISDSPTECDTNSHADK